MNSIAISQAEHVVTKLGGVNATARLLGHRHATTVQGWVKSGFIPGRHHKDILEKARASQIELSEDDFIAHLREPPSGGQPLRATG